MNRRWVWVVIVTSSALMAILGAFLIVISQNPHQPTGGLLVYGP
jgi:hypothetical protein